MGWAERRHPGLRHEGLGVRRCRSIERRGQQRGSRSGGAGRRGPVSDRWNVDLGGRKGCVSVFQRLGGRRPCGQLPSWVRKKRPLREAARGMLVLAGAAGLGQPRPVSDLPGEKRAKPRIPSKKFGGGAAAGGPAGSLVLCI